MIELLRFSRAQVSGVARRRPPAGENRRTRRYGAPFLLFTLLGFFVSIGCTIKNPPVPIVGSLASSAGDVQSAVDVLPAIGGPRLGILAFTDERPEEERKGRRPRGYYLLVWNSRIGTYVTGDKNFHDNVSSDITNETLSLLRTSNLYSDVREIDASGRDPFSSEQMRRLAEEQGVDYILRAQIKHFHGRQYQRAYFIP
ncbi:MAG: hypothetical protein ACRD1Z_05100, partial [Vicinamibacteria bacterium]